MKVLIIGGRRYLGPRLVQRLLDCGHEPVLFNRGRTKAPLPTLRPIREIQGDCRDESSLRHGVQAGRFDAVIDTQAFNGDDAERAIRALEGKIAKYLVISSVACYGRLRAIPADESHPYISDETGFPGEGNSYATGKRDVEQVCLKAHADRNFPAIIIRPSVAYGYARLVSIWGYCTRHVSRIRAGKPIIVPDNGESLIQPIHIDDEAAIIEKALTNEAAIGQAFNCAGPRAVPLWQYFKTHAEVLGKPIACIEIPAVLIHGFDPVRGARSSENLVFNHAYDVSKLQRVLNFKHSYELNEGLKHTIAFLDRWGLMEPTGEIDPEDHLIDSWRREAGSMLNTIGEQLRLKTRHQVPDKTSLINWAPDHYVPEQEGER